MGFWANAIIFLKSKVFANILKNGDYSVPKLSNSRILKVDLSSNDNADFDGSKNVDIGVKGITSILNGGTNANNRRDAFLNLSFLGINPIGSKAEDTPEKWRQVGTGYAFINTDGLLNHQPATYGFVLSFICDSELFQVWKSVGDDIIYTRTASTSGWVRAFYSATIKSTYADYASTDTSKGTIEERLTNLGFKESSINLYTSGGSRVGSVGLKRQGNYVIADFSINSNTASKWSGKIGTLPENFRPINDQEYFIGGRGVDETGKDIPISFTLKVYTTGEIKIPSILSASLQYSTVSLGFEASQI